MGIKSLGGGVWVSAGGWCGSVWALQCSASPSLLQLWTMAAAPSSWWRRTGSGMESQISSPSPQRWWQNSSH